MKNSARILNKLEDVVRGLGFGNNIAKLDSDTNKITLSLTLGQAEIVADLLNKWK